MDTPTSALDVSPENMMPPPLMILYHDSVGMSMASLISDLTFKSSHRKLLHEDAFDQLGLKEYMEEIKEFEEDERCRGKIKFLEVDFNTSFRLRLQRQNEISQDLEKLNNSGSIETDVTTESTERMLEKELIRMKLELASVQSEVDHYKLCLKNITDERDNLKSSNESLVKRNKDLSKQIAEYILQLTRIRQASDVKVSQYDSLYQAFVENKVESRKISLELENEKKKFKQQEALVTHFLKQRIENINVEGNEKLWRKVSQDKRRTHNQSNDFPRRASFDSSDLGHIMNKKIPKLNKNHNVRQSAEKGKEQEIEKKNTSDLLNKSAELHFSHPSIQSIELPKTNQDTITECILDNLTDMEGVSEITYERDQNSLQLRKDLYRSYSTTVSAEKSSIRSKVVKANSSLPKKEPPFEPPQISSECYLSHPSLVSIEKSIAKSKKGIEKLSPKPSFIEEKSQAKPASKQNNTKEAAEDSQCTTSSSVETIDLASKKTKSVHAKMSLAGETTLESKISLHESCNISGTSKLLRRSSSIDSLDLGHLMSRGKDDENDRNKSKSSSHEKVPDDLFFSLPSFEFSEVGYGARRRKAKIKSNNSRQATLKEEGPYLERNISKGKTNSQTQSEMYMSHPSLDSNELCHGSTRRRVRNKKGRASRPTIEIEGVPEIEMRHTFYKNSHHDIDSSRRSSIDSLDLALVIDGLEKNAVADMNGDLKKPTAKKAEQNIPSSHRTSFLTTRKKSKDLDKPRFSMVA